METRKNEVPHCLGLGNSAFFYPLPLTSVEEFRIKRARSQGSVQDAIAQNPSDITSRILLGGAFAIGVVGSLGIIGCAIYEKTTGNESSAAIPPVVWGAYAACAALITVGRLYDSRNNRSR